MMKQLELTYVDALGIIFGNPNLMILPKSCEYLLPLNTKILHYILISIILLKQYHHDEVSQMKLGTIYWIMKRHNNYFGYLIQQNMIELLKKDMMLPYSGLITRLLHAYDIAIPPEEEVIKLDKFSIINRNLLQRMRCTFKNSIWTRLP